MNHLKLLVYVLVICSCNNNNNCEEVMEHFKDGSVKLIHKYPHCNQKSNYTRIHFHHNGKRSSYGKYENGMKNGEFKTWYENGQLSAIWETEKGKPKGMLKCYREEGTLEREAITEGEPYSGYFKFYDEYENIKSEGNSLNDSTRIGKWIEYYENGNPEYIWNYELGKRNGICSTYYESGILESKLIFENGFLKDTIVIYDSKGATLFKQEQRE
jgi:antitoxin component YwqK of YwqJK toxin-antitoxin module